MSGGHENENFHQKQHEKFKLSNVGTDDKMQGGNVINDNIVHSTPFACQDMSNL